jgi:predicted ATPase
MIKRILIDHYKSCNMVELSKLGSCTVLIGRNGAGKTNILQAIKWAAGTATQTGPSGPVYERGFGIPSCVEFAIEAAGRSYKYRITRSLTFTRNQPEPNASFDEELVIQDNDGTVFQIDRKGQLMSIKSQKTSSAAESSGASAPIERQRAGSLNLPAFPIIPSSPMLHVIMSIFTSELALVSAIADLVHELRAVHYYSFDECAVSAHNDSGFVLEDHYKQWLASRLNGGPDEGPVLMQMLHIFRDDHETFDELKQLLGPNGLGLVSDIQVAGYEFPGSGAASQSQENARRFYVIQFYPGARDDADFESGFTFDELSLGTRRVIRILTSILYDKSGIMLLEHPEDGIHSGLARKLFAIIKSYFAGRQLLIASHSLTIFDTLDPEEVRLVAMVKRTTQARSLTAEEVDHARAFMREEGTLSEYLQMTQ